jgi:branched-chain amino acid transport system ATP-binding protein
VCRTARTRAHGGNAMSAAITLRGITVRFGATRVLDGVDLSVEGGERHALIGPNGAGKSTLFRVIAGDLRPDAGRVYLDGVDVTGRAPHRVSRHGLARSFQSTQAFGGLSVRDNLRCAAWAVRGASWRSWLPRARASEPVETRVAELLHALGLAAVAGRAAGTLGYAQQRALDLGIALASGARTLLVDEPTAGMDRDEARGAIALLAQASEGHTLLMIEHDMEAVFGLADRISVLVRGAIVATGTPAAIRSDPLVRAAYLGEATP